MTPRPGVALLTVLWVLAVASALGLAAAAGGRSGVDAARFRLHSTEQSWRAYGCASLALGALDEQYRQAEDEARRSLWASLDRAAAQLEQQAYSDCRVHLESANGRFDIANADEEALRRFIDAAASPGHAPALLDAFLDWQDADDVARPRGAESAWYLSHDRRPPSNRRIAVPEELRAIRGFDAYPRLMQLVTTTPSTIDILHAAPEVLSTIPGFSAGMTNAVLSRRAEGWRPADLRELTTIVDAVDGATFVARYVDAARVTTLEPSAWNITATVADASGLSTRTERWRIARQADGLHMEARLVW